MLTPFCLLPCFPYSFCFLERMSELIHALLHFGYASQSRSLQVELSGFLADIAREEARPMPMMENPTPEQRRAITQFWNWPAMAHPDRNLPPRTEHLLLPFFFPPPPPPAAALEQSNTTGSASASSAPTAAIKEDEDENIGGFGMFE